ncbi:MAG: hypothetical protein A3F11_00580 [Gammaproteobacteria bacterium RIFCSPHIGHO2_12_FULL_37_14]|nr:MAG: hypothetical protein A3F11_00580 [Gammaproteobacteria bacterium RIFCSPHIGHO2_12_FULL_37_14]
MRKDNLFLNKNNSDELSFFSAVNFRIAFYTLILLLMPTLIVSEFVEKISKKSLEVDLKMNNSVLKLPLFENQKSVPSLPLVLVNPQEAIANSLMHLRNATFLFVIDACNIFLVAPSFSFHPILGDYEQKHSLLVNGEPVISAGEIAVKSGKITVSTKSGHYKPRLEKNQERLIRAHLFSHGITDFKFEKFKFDQNRTNRF